MASDLLLTKSKKGEGGEEEEEEENERVRERISSLPMCNGWITQYHYLYQGFWYMYKDLEGTMFAQEHFKARSTDILLATNPKCGTTWLKGLAFAILNRTEYPKSLIHTHPLLTRNPHLFVPYLEFDLFLTKSLAKSDNQPSPHLYATYMPYTSLPESVLSSGCRFVYLCRNPKDVLVSMWHFSNKSKNKEVARMSLQEACDSFCRGESPFGPYWDHVLGYYNASLKWPERIMFLNYEGIHGDTYNHVKSLAEFLGYSFSIEEEAEGVVQQLIQLCSFETMSNKMNKKHNNDEFTYDAFFRKGVVCDSNNYLTTEMVERLERITEEKLRGFQLSF